MAYLQTDHDGFSLRPESSRGARHAWLCGEAADCFDLALRLDGARMIAIWAEGTWRPERLLTILETHLTLTQVFEARDLTRLREAEGMIAVNPALYRKAVARMVLVTPHLPSLTAAELATAGIAVFGVGRLVGADRPAEIDAGVLVLAGFGALASETLP